MGLIISNKVRLEVMPDGNLAMEIGDCEAVVVLKPQHARQVATRMRTLLCGDSNEDLAAERTRIDRAIYYKRRKRYAPSAGRAEAS